MKNHNEIISQFEPLWGSWKVEEFVGQGNFGSVYKIFREDWGQKYISALKLISIPQTENDIKEASSIGIDENSVHGYFEGYVKNIVSEIELMYKLKGNSNIVNYEDHLIIKKENEFGWYILIKMEYLQPLSAYIQNGIMSVEEVAKLGIDICKALEACEIEKIIHRDIKDANIFISKNGNYKLGDFGIARELSRSGRAASMRGTPLYMAPEVYKGESYDATVDTYSLGIVLYKLLNNGRLPFMPPYPNPITYMDTENSIDCRMRGDVMTGPSNANSAFGDIVIKACSYYPKDRFSSPTELRVELEKMLKNSGILSAEELEKNIPIDQTAIVEEENKVEYNHTVSVYNTSSHGVEHEIYKDKSDSGLDKSFDGTVSIFSNINKADVEEEVEEVVEIPKLEQQSLVVDSVERDVESKKKTIFSKAIGIAAALIIVSIVAVFALSNGGKKEAQVTNLVPTVTPAVSSQENVQATPTPTVIPTPTPTPTVTPAPEPSKTEIKQPTKKKSDSSGEVLIFE